jgi:hypothetical protein
MNGSSFVGRLSPGFFAQRLGVVNMVTAASGVGAVLILCMIALKSIASVVIIGVLYGYTAGICVHAPPFLDSDCLFRGIVVSLMAPLLTTLTDNIGELG